MPILASFRKAILFSYLTSPLRSRYNEALRTVTSSYAEKEAVSAGAGDQTTTPGSNGGDKSPKSPTAVLVYLSRQIWLVYCCAPMTCPVHLDL